MELQKEEIEYYRDLGINTNTPLFKRCKNAGLLEYIDESFIKEVNDYWQKYYHRNVNPVLHLAFMNLTGKKDPRVAFPLIVWNELIPFFNDQNMNGVYMDKNLYDKLIPSKRAVETVLKRSHGYYFDNQNNWLDKKDALSEALSFQEDLIVKPSNTNNGMGIEKLYYQDGFLFLNNERLTLKNLEKKFGANFAIQKVVQQHTIMAEPHPSSVNTLRMVTLRWNDEIRYLLTFARFGANNGVQDNAGAGGVCVGVTENGEFLDKAVDENFIAYTEHPTTGFSFKDMQSIPNFDQFKDYVKELHEEVLHHDFISWDIVVGADGLPVFLEANFKGATWLYQMAAQQPLFGDLTEEILEHVYKERNNRSSPRWKNLSSAKNRPNLIKLNKRIRLLQDRNKKLIKENTELQKGKENVVSLQNEKKSLEKKITDIEMNLASENEDLLKRKEHFRKKYEEIQQSRSWRVTAPIRKISSLFKG